MHPRSNHLGEMNQKRDIHSKSPLHGSVHDRGRIPSLFPIESNQEVNQAKIPSKNLVVHMAPTQLE